MLTLWTPLGGHFGLRHESDDWYDNRPSNGNRVDFAPAVDIEEKEDHYLVSADLPGVSEKDIEVKIEDGILLLSGKRGASEEQKAECRCHSERSFGTFHRCFKLGEGVAADKIEAAYANGVLTVKLPKSERMKARQIPVHSN